MKRLILGATVATLGVIALAANAATRSSAAVHTHVARFVDDPPPEPVECPFCGGNAQLHVRRLFAVTQYADVIAMHATRW